MSAATKFPGFVSDETDQLFERLLEKMGDQSLDTPTKKASAATFSVALLLPRYAGTMLLVLCRTGPCEPAQLVEEAARLQGKKLDDPAVQLRLTIALDYLRRTGCATDAGNRVQLTDFGKEVFRIRFGNDGLSNRNQE